MKKGGVSRMFEGWKGGIRGVEKLDFDWHWVFNWLSGWLIELIEVDWWCSMSWMRLIVVKSGCFRLLKWIVSVKKKVCVVFSMGRACYFLGRLVVWLGQINGKKRWKARQIECFFDVLGVVFSCMFGLLNTLNKNTKSSVASTKQAITIECHGFWPSQLTKCWPLTRLHRSIDQVKDKVKGRQKLKMTGVFFSTKSFLTKCWRVFFFFFSPSLFLTLMTGLFLSVIFVHWHKTSGTGKKKKQDEVY